jgi:transposase
MYNNGKSNSRSLAMMGQQNGFQEKLFITGFNLDKRIPENHILRKISETIDFDFIYREVKHTYGAKGNVSVPPPVILKLMLLLFLFNVRSERELMTTLPLRLDWLWFLGYDIEDNIPNHSVLSKARTRWGVHAFKRFFDIILQQCVEAGLIDGDKAFIDSSLVDADASNNSVVNMHDIKRYLKKSYRLLEERLDDFRGQKSTLINKKHVSTTDPDASVTRYGNSRPKLRYKTHRVVDEKNEIITATKLTPGSVDDGAALKEMIDIHQQNIGTKPEAIVADTKYGTIDNYLHYYDEGIKTHIPSVEETHKGVGSRKGIFTKEEFTYKPDEDIFICPMGGILTKRKYKKKRKHFEYKASPKACNKCDIKDKCTRSKSGRTLKRHERQDELDEIIERTKSIEVKKDLKTRQHLSERSFARSTRYGFKRARWRNLWRMEIQDYLIAAIQNITVLINQPINKMSKSNVQESRKSRPDSLIERIKLFYKQLRSYIYPGFLIIRLKN